MQLQPLATCHLCYPLRMLDPSSSSPPLHCDRNSLQNFSNLSLSNSFPYLSH